MNEKKCNKYESYFLFRNEEDLLEHLKNCPDCKSEHEKYEKVSKLLKEVAPLYFAKKQKLRQNMFKKVACFLVFLTGLSVFGYYHYYDEYSYQNFISDEYYISTLGLPTDEYGFLEL